MEVKQTMKLRVANHETFGNVRYTINNGELMFAGSDIIKGLKLTNNTMLVDCIEADDKCELEVDEKETDRSVRTIMINSCGLQSLISSCRMNSIVDVKEYKRWLIKDIGLRAIKELELSRSDKFILDAIHKAYGNSEVKLNTKSVSNTEDDNNITQNNDNDKLYSIRDITSELLLAPGVVSDCLIKDLEWMSKYNNLKTGIIKKGYAIKTGSGSNQFKFTESGFKKISETIKNNSKKLSNNDFPADITGFKFGKLTILNKYNDGMSMMNSIGKWNAVCECGKKSTPTRGNLIRGKSKSCGCGIHKIK